MLHSKVYKSDIIIDHSEAKNVIARSIVFDSQSLTLARFLSSSIYIQSTHACAQSPCIGICICICVGCHQIPLNISKWSQKQIKIKIIVSRNLAKLYWGNLSPSFYHSRAAHISSHIIGFVKIPRKWGKLEVEPLFVDTKIPPLTINRWAGRVNILNEKSQNESYR